MLRTHRRFTLLALTLLVAFAACKFVESKVYIRSRDAVHQMYDVAGGSDGRMVGIHCDAYRNIEPDCFYSVYQNGIRTRSWNLFGRYTNIERGTNASRYWLARRFTESGKQPVIEEWSLSSDERMSPGATLTWQGGNPFTRVLAIASGPNNLLYVSGLRASNGVVAIGRFRIDRSGGGLKAVEGSYQTLRAGTTGPLVWPAVLEVDRTNGTLHVADAHTQGGGVPHTVMSYNADLTPIDKDAFDRDWVSDLKAEHGLLGVLSNAEFRSATRKLEVFSGGTSTTYRLWDSVTVGDFAAGSAAALVYEPDADYCGYLWTFGNDLDDVKWLQRHEFCYSTENE